MKILENKETRLKNQDGETYTLYSDLINHSLNIIPQGGISPSEMRKRVRIIKSLEKAPLAGNIIKFEDNDAENLKQIVKTSKWSLIHEDILNFQDDVDSMKIENK